MRRAKDVTPKGKGKKPNKPKKRVEGAALEEEELDVSGEELESGDDLEGVELYDDPDQASDDESDHDDEEVKEIWRIQEAIDSLEYSIQMLQNESKDAKRGDAAKQQRKAARRQKAIADLQTQIRELEEELAEEMGCDLDDIDHDMDEESLPEDDDASVWLDSDDSVSVYSEREAEGLELNLDEDFEADVDAVEEEQPLIASALTDGASLTTDEAVAKAREFVAAKTKPAPVTLPEIPAPTKYARQNPTVKGIYTLACINIDWANRKGPGKGKVASMGSQMRKHYMSLSDNRYGYQPTAMSFKVNLNRAPKNVNKAAQQVMAKANAIRRSKGLPPFQKFAIVHGGARKYSNAGKNIMYLMGTLTRTALHEGGHTDPTRFGHAGKYDNGGKGKLQAYGDRGTFMGAYSSVVLNGPELWGDGWTAKEKVAQYDLGDAPTMIDMEPLYADKQGNSVKGVLIPRAEGRDMFLSNFNRQGQNYLSLYYFTGKGSGGSSTNQGIGTQQIKVFNKETEWDGLIVKRVATADGIARLELSTSPSFKLHA